MKVKKTKCPNCGEIIEVDVFVTDVIDNIERVYIARRDCMLVLAGGQL